MRLSSGALLISAFVVMAAASAAAQDEILAKAREAAVAGRRDEALKMLDARLAAVPQDVDARLLYGLVLSWEGRFDEARPVFRQVLTQAPAYTDARVALMNVEHWTGHSREALELANQILAKDPGNTTARAVRERVEASLRPWWVRTDYTFDTFNDGREDWHEVSLTLTRRTPIGPVLVRGSHAERFGDQDDLVEVEFYPRFRPGTYAYLSAGGSPSPTLFPKARFAFDLYQAVGRGFEVSGGARAMTFDTSTRIYLGTLSKYVGNWMLTLKVSRVDAEEDDSTTYQGGFRYYYGADGTSYAGFNYSDGLSREEVYSAADLATLHARTVRGELDHLFGTRFRLFALAATSRQERSSASPLWQTTLSTGLQLQF